MFVSHVFQGFECTRFPDLGGSWLYKLAPLYGKACLVT